MSVAQKRNVLMINPDKCAGCRICEVICSFHHCRESNPARSRISIVKWEEEGVDFPMMCQQCEKPICVDTCPVRALSIDQKTGAILVDEKRCLRCRICVTTCPFGGLTIDVATGAVITCDLCGGEPKCVEWCPTRAIEYIRADRMGMKKKRAGIERMSELLKMIIEKMI